MLYTAFFSFRYLEFCDKVLKQLYDVFYSRTIPASATGQQPPATLDEGDADSLRPPPAPLWGPRLLSKYDATSAPVPKNLEDEQEKKPQAFINPFTDLYGKISFHSNRQPPPKK